MYALFSDARILRTIQAGHTEAFGVLVRRHTPAVFAVAYAHTANRADAEDIVQETFIKALQAIGELREAGALRGWLTTIARNTARTWLSRRVRERAILEGLERNEAVVSAEKQVERRELVEAHIGRIDASQREALMMHYFAGLSVREIADALEIQPEAVKKRLQRAREALGREVLEGIALPGEKLDRASLRGRVLAGLALPPFSWRSAVHTYIPAAAPAVAKAAVAGVVIAALASVAFRSEPPREPRLPSAAAPIVLAQAEPADASGGGATSTGPERVLGIEGRMVKQEVATANAVGGISGRVETPEGLGAPGVAVRIERITWDDHESGPAEREEWTVETDVKGAFAFAKIPLGQYGVVAQTQGFTGAESATLRTGAAHPYVTLRLQTSLPIRGVVQDLQGRAIAGAVVFPHSHDKTRRGRPMVWSETTAMRVFSDAEGRFDFPGLYEGKWTLLAKAEGYAATLTEPIAAGTTEAIIAMAKGGSVAGRVIHLADGKPAGGMTLLFRGDLDRVLNRTVADDKGAFVMENLREGRYAIIPDDPALVATAESAFVEVTANEVKTGLVVELREGGRVKGRVYDSSNKQGMANVTVTASPSGAAGLERTAVSAEDGAFEIAGLGSGPYMVSPEPPKGYKRPFGSYQSGRETPIDLDGPVAIRDCDLEPAAEIMGRVIDEAGEPVAGARVGLAGGGGTYVGTSTDTAADGFFQFESMPRTTDLWLLATKGTLTSEALELDTEEQHLLSLEIVLRPGAVVEGTVVDEAGKPVPNVGIRASMMSARNGGGAAQADARGAFVLEGLAKGEYLLLAQEEDGPYMVYGDRDTRQRISVDFGERITGYTLLYTEGASISGVVVDPDGRPVPDVEILGASQTRSDAEGRFECKGFFAEYGQLSFSKEGYVQQTIPLIPAGTADLVVTLVPSATIRGRIVDAASGAPLEMAQIGAHQPGPEFILTTNAMGFLAKVQLTDGQFEYPSDLVGDILLVVRAEGYAVRTMPLTVEAGKPTAELLVELEPAAPLQVTVTAPSGAPVAGASIYQGRITNGSWARNEDREGETDASGSAEIATYVVGGVVSAYHPDWGAGHATIPSGDDRAVTIALSGTAVLSGAVLSPDGPVAEAQVYLSNGQRDTVDDWRAVTEADGAYRLERAPIGAFTLWVSARYAPDSGGAWQREMPVTLTADGNTVDIDVPLGPASVEIDVSAVVGASGQYNSELTQPAVAPGMRYSSFTSQGAPLRFEGIHPGPAELTVSVRHASGQYISYGPYAVTIPEQPAGAIVLTAP